MGSRSYLSLQLHRIWMRRRTLLYWFLLWHLRKIWFLFSYFLYLFVTSYLFVVLFQKGVWNVLQFLQGWVFSLFYSLFFIFDCQSHVGCFGSSLFVTFVINKIDSVQEISGVEERDTHIAKRSFLNLLGVTWFLLIMKSENLKVVRSMNSLGVIFPSPNSAINFKHLSRCFEPTG